MRVAESSAEQGRQGRPADPAPRTPPRRGEARLESGGLWECLGWEDAISIDQPPGRHKADQPQPTAGGEPGTSKPGIARKQCTELPRLRGKQYLWSMDVELRLKKPLKPLGPIISYHLVLPDDLQGQAGSGRQMGGI